MKAVYKRVVEIIVIFVMTCSMSTFSGVTPLHQVASASPLLQQKNSSVQVVRIKAATPQQRERLVALGIDLLEMRQNDDLFALLSPQQQKYLSDNGWDIRVDATQTALLSRQLLQQSGTPGFPSGYRSVEETEQFLYTIASAYPQLTSLSDYGDSWEKVHTSGTKGHDLLALHITNHAINGLKPVFVLMGAIHARELVTSELATRYISYLLTNYGKDPDVTWMLNENEVVVIPIANPDGRKIAEQGKLQRKNTNPGMAVCGTNSDVYYANQPGVDLNRNASFSWGTIDTPSLSPCAQTYPGTAASSEPEEAALESLLRTLFADRRGPENQDAAPDDTSGVFITLHSFGDLVLWPWGSSRIPTPNGVAFARLGQHFAHFNGFTPQQSYDLYPTSGTTDDWLYGERGVASFTFEVGPDSDPVCAGFFPPAICLDEGQRGRFWSRNLPAFLYATRVARAPYTQPAGPDVEAINVISDTAHITITATLSGAANDQQPITAAELFLNQSSPYGGTPISMQPVDGTFDTSKETVYAVLSATQVETNTLLLVHGRSGNIWGPLWATWAMHAPRVLPLSMYRVWFPISMQKS